MDKYALELQQILVSESYVSNPVTNKIVRSPKGKIRKCKVPKFYPDLCIQWALMLQLEPILMKGMYQYNCGSIPGRGPHFAKRKIEKWIRNDFKKTKYCLQLDIKQFYDSVSQEVLLEKFKKKIKDEKVINLISTILSMSDKGVPLGFYTSPWFANFYLQDFDHYIKEKTKVTFYVRYIDDILIFSQNKKRLHKLQRDLTNKLNDLNLSMKPNWQVFLTSSRPIDYIGFKFYRTHTVLRKRTALRFSRRIKKNIKKKN